MPWVVSGTVLPPAKSSAKLVKELLESQWPTTSYDPVKSRIKFGLSTWDKSGDIQIHVNTEPAQTRPFVIGGSAQEVTDPVSIRIFLRKNTRTVPDTLESMQYKVEEICLDNQSTLATGYTFRFDGWGAVFEADNLKDVWQLEGRATAIYCLLKA